MTSSPAPAEGRHRSPERHLRGTNNLVEQLGGRAPMALEVFIEKHRAAFV